MSDLLTHWAVADDCLRIAAKDAATDAALIAVADAERPYFYLGAITRYGSQWSTEMQMLLRDVPAEDLSTPATARKMAFALGGIAHYPADLVLKPLMTRLAQADWNRTHHAMQAGEAGAVSVREISAYYDCHVFREVYGAGDQSPFNRFLLAPNETSSGQALESFVRSLFQRALLACHTLAPDRNDFSGWLDRLIAQVQPLYLEIDLYTRVFQQPDPEKIAAFEVETSFYRRDDPAIVCARAIAAGATPSQEEIDAAVASSANASGYGQAVALGVRTLRAASEYRRGEREEPPSLKQ
ncbi:MAG: hypothetical protein SFU56_04480 [Capsulimonadales bacterium]|nr:hypothetical protein [Capsulimonadales bacterium]